MGFVGKKSNFPSLVIIVVENSVVNIDFQKVTTVRVYLKEHFDFINRSL